MHGKNRKGEGANYFVDLKTLIPVCMHGQKHLGSGSKIKWYNQLDSGTLYAIISFQVVCQKDLCFLFYCRAISLFLLYSILSCSRFDAIFVFQGGLFSYRRVHLSVFKYVFLPPIAFSCSCSPLFHVM